MANVMAEGQLDPYIVSPGIYGFLTFLVLALFGWMLFASFSRHIRKANFHAREREEAEYGEAAPPARRQIPIDPNLKPRQGPFSETVLGRERSAGKREGDRPFGGMPEADSPQPGDAPDR